MTRYCRTCRRMFEADEDWKLDCLDCYKRRKREQEQRENETWREEHARRDKPDELLERHIRRFAADVQLLARRLAEHDLEHTYQQGYAAGLAAARTLTAGAALDAGFLRELVALCHPDRHPGRTEKATRATQRLLEALDERREAA